MPAPHSQNKGTYGPEVDRRLAAWATSPGRHCVISRDELRDELEFTDTQIKVRVRRGQLHRLHRAVYAIGHTHLTAKGRWRAAVLACGAAALLSHRPAGALHDVMTIPVGLIDVTAPRRRRHPGLRTHLAEVDGTVVDGIPVVTLPVVYLQLAATGPPRWVARALDQAQRRNVFDAGPIRALLDGADGEPGAEVLAQALDALPDEPEFLQSELERRLLELCVDHGLPHPLFNQYVAGHLVDCLWPQQRIVVEVDGWDTHRTRRAFEDDRARDVAITLAGYTVLRFTWRQVTETPHQVAKALARIL